MKTQDFSVTISVPQNVEQAFNAITNIGAWWSASIEGGTTKLNDEFIYHYRDIHYCKMKLVESVPNKKLVWLVLDNYFKFTKDKSEWIGTHVVFDIVQKDKQTEIIFTHQGLVPQYECYEICEKAWTGYITGSLHNLITTGQGQPNPKEDDGFDVHLVEQWKLAQ